MYWATLGLLGGVVGLDATSVAQTMISRPLMAATITGALAGRPAEGVLLGVILELFALMILPVGAARYPESGTAAVAATGAYMLATPLQSPSVLLLAVLFSLLWENVSGASVVFTRRLNERVVRPLALTGARPDRALENRHRTAVAMDFLRAALVTLIGTLVGTYTLRGLAQLWTLSAVVAPAIMSIGMTCMVAAGLQLFGGFRAQKLAFGIGLGIGVMLLFLQ